MNEIQVTPVLTIIDGALLLLLIISALMAMARGFTREITGFCAFGTAVLGSTFLARPLSPMLNIFDFRPLANKLSLSVATISTYATGILLFVILWVVAWLIGESIARRVQSVPAISALDRVLGFIYGLARGLLVAVMVFLAYTSMVGRNNYSTMLSNARLLPLLQNTSSILIDMVPPDMQRYFKQQNSPWINTNTTAAPALPNISEAVTQGALRAVDPALNNVLQTVPSRPQSNEAMQQILKQLEGH